MREGIEMLPFVGFLIKFSMGKQLFGNNLAFCRSILMVPRPIPSNYYLSSVNRIEEGRIGYVAE